MVDRKYRGKSFFWTRFFSNIFFGEDPPAPNSAAFQAQTVVTPPVSAGPAATADAAKTTKSSTDAFEDSGKESTAKRDRIKMFSKIVFWILEKQTLSRATRTRIPPRRSSSNPEWTYSSCLFEQTLILSQFFTQLSIYVLARIKSQLENRLWRHKKSTNYSLLISFMFPDYIFCLL